MRKTVSVFSLPRAAAIMSLVALASLVAPYPASLHAQTSDGEDFTKPVNVSAEVVQGSTSADGSTVTVRLEWEEDPRLAQGNLNRTGFCYAVWRFQDGVQLSSTEYCRTSSDNSVEFGVSSSLSSVELQVRLVFDETRVGTNSDTVTVTLSG